MDVTLDRIEKATVDKPITAEKLRTTLGLPIGSNDWKKQLNHMANHWSRERDLHVVSGPNGYFYARCEADFDVAITWSRTKAMSILHRLSHVRKMKAKYSRIVQSELQI
jgi:hypothetical protein